MLTVALDPSTHFGWCFHRQVPSEADPEKLIDKIEFGTWELQTDAERKAKARVRPGAYFARAMGRLTELRKRLGIYDEPLQIVIEDTSLNAIGTRDTKHLAESWVGQFETYAEVRGWPEPVAVAVNSWRSAFIGMSSAPKEVGAGLEDGPRLVARQKWIKAATIAACRKRGLHVTDDNQADAVGIMFWFLKDGHHVQQVRRENKRAKTRAKRAQLKLFAGKARAA